MSIGRRIFAVTVFPLVLGGSVAWALLALERGVSPEKAILGPTVVPALLLIVLEHVFPYHRSWLRNHDDLGVDVAYLAWSGLFAGLAQGGVYLAIAPAAVWLSGRVGAPLWPQAWPLLAQLVLALVVAELPKYWFHRLEHEHDWLWRIHATHHSVPRLYWVNAARFHPLDIAIDTGLGLAVLVFLGCGAKGIALFLLVSAVHGYFQHANLELRLGPLNWFFSMAELHRWHHSKTVREANHNYGQNLIVWDWVFGTRFLPVDREPPEETGLAGLPAFPSTFWAQQLSPFRWARIKAASLGSDSYEVLPDA